MQPVRIEVDDPERDWTAAGVFEVSPQVYRVPLPLPMDGLRAVNVYAVSGPSGLTLVDSGWAVAAGRDALLAALEALGSTVGDVQRILVTHAHRDHYTLGVALRREFGVRVALGAGEEPSLRVIRSEPEHPLAAMRRQLRAAGTTALEAELAAVDRRLSGVEDFADPDEWLAADTALTVAGRSWQVHPTPGHTRGHVVFVDPAQDVMYAGDHVLPRISPSIGFEPAPVALPLGDYLDSLRLVAALPDRRLLPAHGPVGPSVHARVAELIEHHDTRLAQSREAVAAGRTSAYDVALALRWTRRGRAFAELDLLSRCLAVTETIAHLDVLVAAGTLTTTAEDGVTRYRVP